MALRTTGGVPVLLLRTAKYKGVHVTWALERPLDETRAARALLADLLTRGTARQPGMAAFAARCEELYGTEITSSATAHGPSQLIQFGLETIADSCAHGRALFDEATGLLAECLHDPPRQGGALRPDHVAQEQANLVRAIAALADDKPGWAWRRLVETMHGDSAYGRHPWGTLAGARALDEPAVRAAWRDLVERAPARLLVVGDVSETQALATAERLAGPARRDPIGPPHRPPRAERRDVVEVVERQALNQSRLVMGLRVPPELLDGQAANLFTLVYGGGSHSRLFKRVREAESLAYGCGATLLKDSASIVVQAGVDARHTERARALVLEELGRLATDGVGAGELDLSRREALRRLASLRDSPAGACSFVLTALLSGRPHDIDTVIDQVAAVTPEDVAAVAAACWLDAVYVLEGDDA